MVGIVKADLDPEIAEDKRPELVLNKDGQLMRVIIYRGHCIISFKQKDGKLYFERKRSQRLDDSKDDPYWIPRRLFILGIRQAGKIFKDHRTKAQIEQG